MGFCHCGIFNNNNLFANQKSFLSSDDIRDDAIFTCAGLSFSLICHTGNSENNKEKQKISLNNLGGGVKQFLHLAERRPTFVCDVCNRCLYARCVMECRFNKYDLDLAGIIHKVTTNDMTYLCNTYYSYLGNCAFKHQIAE